MNKPSATDSALDSYLGALEAALSDLPSTEREDILLETRSHVLDQLARTPARTEQQVLGELGMPQSYARRFITERSQAHEPETTLLRIARLSTAGPKGWLVLLLVVIGYSVATFALLIALWKVLAPDQVGYWVHYVDGVRHKFVGVTDIKQQGREILGWWSAIIPLTLAIVIHLGLSALLRRVAPRTVESRSS